MMKLLPNNLFFIFCSAVMSLMAVIVLWAFFWQRSVVTASFDQYPQYACQLPDVFSLSWRHSVEKQYWQEVYTFTNDKLILQKSYVQTYGAGVPSDGTPTPAPPGYVGQQINRPISQLNLLISNTMNAKLYAGDTLTLQTSAAHTPNTSLSQHTTSHILPIHSSTGGYVALAISPKTLSIWQSYHLKACF